MILIPNLSASANQQFSVLLTDKSVVKLTLVFRPRIQRWVVDVSYSAGAKIANGLMLSQHVNLLRTFRGVWPFGLAVVSTDGADPFKIDDFSSGRILLYVLDNTAGSTADVDYVEETLLT